MAHKHKPNKSSIQKKVFSLKLCAESYLSYEYFQSIIVNPTNLFPTSCFLILLEILINIAIINYVKYTEIDWKAYMQEVEGVLNGTFDYSLLKGDTGPLVYPAGFVWIFSCLYFLTNRGENILRGQYIFAAFYILNLLLVLRILIKSKKLPPYVIVITFLSSYRIHSIFTLRLFNDPIAIILFHASINAFLDSNWSIGSFFYSLAVSVKMNILLFAPALFLAYLLYLGTKKTIEQLIICASVQLILALPFLLTNPINYITGAFNFGRIFMYKWTVNWRFLPEEIFVDRKFHLLLLIVHIVLLGLFYKPCYLYIKSFSKLKILETDIRHQTKKSNFTINSSQLFLLPMFLCNFIGVVCSRSLHYQFYIWYFYSLPFLLWSTQYSIPLRLFLLGIIELCWNTYPSTALSSFSLLCCHFSILYGIYKSQSKILKFVSDLEKKK